MRDPSELYDLVPVDVNQPYDVREVIAFPKSGGGYDPLTGAPAAITADQRRETGVDTAPKAPNEHTDAKPEPEQGV